MYEWTNSKQHYTVEELGRILLTDTVPEEKICHIQPTQVQHNVTFVVNLHLLGDPKDLRADDNGVWKRRGAPITSVSLHKRHDGTPIVIRRTKMGTHSHHYKISRTYYHHSSSKDFHRIITTVQGMQVMLFSSLCSLNYYCRCSRPLPTISFCSVYL